MFEVDAGLSGDVGKSYRGILLPRAEGRGKKQLKYK
jgi:hypothetical protein